MTGPTRIRRDQIAWRGSGAETTAWVAASLNDPLLPHLTRADTLLPVEVDKYVMSISHQPAADILRDGVIQN